MKISDFATMSERQKEKIIKSVIQATNKDQRKLMQEYKKKFKTK